MEPKSLQRALRAAQYMNRQKVDPPIHLFPSLEQSFPLQRVEVLNRLFDLRLIADDRREHSLQLCLLLLLPACNRVSRHYDADKGGAYPSSMVTAFVFTFFLFFLILFPDLRKVVRRPFLAKRADSRQLTHSAPRDRTNELLLFLNPRIHLLELGHLLLRGGTFLRKLLRVVLELRRRDLGISKRLLVLFEGVLECLELVIIVAKLGTLRLKLRFGLGVSSL
jgi:hypothetical protein